MYTVNFGAYCGMRTITETLLDLSDARGFAAHVIARRRRRRYGVVTLTAGEQCVVLEPNDSAMTPDECGLLWIEHQTFACRDCGSATETRDAALECCVAEN